MADTSPTLGSGGQEARLGVLTNQIPFELGQRPEDVKDELAAAGGRVSDAATAPSDHERLAGAPAIQFCFPAHVLIVS